MSVQLPRRLQRLTFRIGLASHAFGRTSPLEPVSRSFGFDRGLPIDRFYIEGFLRRHGSWSEYSSGASQRASVVQSKTICSGPVWPAPSPKG